MKAGAAVPGRRPRVSRDAYRATARSVGIAPRLRRRIVILDVAILAVAGAFLLLTGPLIGSAVSDGVRQITEGVGQSLGGQLGTAQIELPSSPASIAWVSPHTTMITGASASDSMAHLSVSLHW